MPSSSNEIYYQSIHLLVDQGEVYSLNFQKLALSKSFELFLSHKYLLTKVLKINLKKSVIKERKKYLTRKLVRLFHLFTFGVFFYHGMNLKITHIKIL